MATSIEKRLDNHRQSNRLATDSQGFYTNPVLAGVTVAWLSEAFNMPAATVRYRLRTCPVKTSRMRGEKMRVTLYDLRTAARFLVAPAFSTKEYMRALKAGDLPGTLQQSIWDAMLKRQKWEENAKMLWRTDDVRAVLGSTFQSIKFNMQLWVDTIERNTEITDRQREVLLEQVDALQQEIFDSLVKKAAESKTGPQTVELEERFGETETVEEAMVDDYTPEEDQEIMDLV